MMDHLLILPLLLPLCAGSILILAPGSATTLRRMFDLSATALLLVAALILVLRVADEGLLVYRLGDWPAPFGIVLVADRLAAVLVLVTAVLALCVAAHVAQGSDRLGVQFHSLFQFQLFGLNGAFLTGDLFNLFVFFEVLLIASYGLLLHGGGRERLRAGMHYVVINLIGSTLFLFAVGALYGTLGTLNMADLALRMQQVPSADVGIVRAAGLLLLVVFALKAAVVPLHLWLPGAYANTSAGVAALFAIMTKVGVYAILRVHSLIFGAAAGPLAGLYAPWLLPLGLITLVAGTIGALASRRLSQLTAYLVVTSVGTLLIGFGIGGGEAVAGSVYYLAHSTFAAATLFLLVDLLRRARGSDVFESGPPIAGAAILGTGFAIAAMAIAGMPPLSGFVGKFLILKSSITSDAMPWILGVVMTTSLLVIVALARGGSRMFFRVDAGNDGSAPLLRPTAMLPAGALAVLGIGLAAFAGPVYDYGAAAAEQLLQPYRYFDAVLEHGLEPAA